MTVGIAGINLAGLEGGYGTDDPANGSTWQRSAGPRPGQDYPLHSPGVIDYYFSKNVQVIRLLFSWERLQSQLWGTVPDPLPGYARYFENFKSIVDYATSLGMTVIIEPWQAGSTGGVGGARWRGQLIGDPPDEVDRYAFADLWRQLARVFRHNPAVEYGLVNEPNQMSTMSWWKTAQKCVDSIREAGAASTIYIPGNGYTAASTWTEDWIDTGGPPQRSNAYGWLNANDGAPLFDPLNNVVAELHLYLDQDASGNGNDIVSGTIARDRLAPAVSEAAANGYRVFVGEIGLYAGGNPAHRALAQAVWSDFISYLAESDPTSAGFAWWAGGWPQWWPDPNAPHFSVSPTNAATLTGDTVNMVLVEGTF